ncbi:MAG: metal-dependent hydrolase [Phormidesmis priestleyi]|uniref:Metal-dependent hydrolase n=1 Tax=Phormidesmis priestleyi TaxID=268141 RepID=A0A2W4ZNI7_9CYAN|nr:MAG: metal-dependent hydrolase [Phormidesmis priestleyi]
MKGWLKGLSLLVGLPVGAIALFYIWGTAGSYGQQNYAAVVNYLQTPLNEGEVAKPTHTIVSYNIGYLSGLANNTTAETDSAFFEANLQRVTAALQAVKPDIVAFQAIDFASKRSYHIDQAKAIAQAVNLINGALAISWDKNYVPFPYWPPAAQFGKIVSGQAILSRWPYPIQSNRRLMLEKVASNPFYYNAFYLDRLAQVSEILVGGKPLMVINVHLEAFDEPTRVKQTQFVRAIAEDYAKTYPVIVLGDFNSSLNRPEESAFSINVMKDSEQFASAVPEADWGKAMATFPSNQPEYTLDYIWYTPSTIEVVSTEVISAAGEASDHLPLMMEFRLKD